MDLSADQQELQIEYTVSMLAHFNEVCKVHGPLLQDIARVPMTASSHTRTVRCWLRCSGCSN